MYKIIFAIILTISINSCSTKKIDNYEAVYEVELIGSWSNESHPTNFPDNAHFSPMIGLSHVSSLDVIAVNLAATSDIKIMAETGKTDPLKEAFIKFHNQKLSKDYIVGESFNSPGNNKAEIGLARGFHHVTIFSMIAPSPDWFIAASTSLIDPADGKWYDEVIVYANAYDAGTDNGLNFTSENSVSTPQEKVQLINSGPLTEGTDTVINMAKFIFRRIKE